MDADKSTIGGLPRKPQFVNYTGMAEAPEYAEIGARLTLIRTSLSDLTQRAWAEKQGFNQTQYNNWEKGIRRITVDAAEVLCTKYGLTLDAIYRGRLDGLSEIARKIF
ncbi:MAG: helix-turn-helix transcriptional regulator [Rhodobacteraceae bacterium]|nr:helix-turn-helix transcriptional regulator [Paracoccaceae bacterium]